MISQCVFYKWQYQTSPVFEADMHAMIGNVPPTVGEPHTPAWPARGRSRSVGRRARSVPDDLMIGDDPDLLDDHAQEPNVYAMKMGTIRLQMQISKMEEATTNQAERQSKMENTANELTNALSNVLTQVETQTSQRKELLQIHHQCLEDIKSRSEDFSNSQKALEITAEAMIAQRDRDVEQYSHGMQSLYRRTSDQEQLLQERGQKDENDRQTEAMRKNELIQLNRRLQQLELDLSTAKLSSTTASAPANSVHVPDPSSSYSGPGMSRPGCGRCQDDRQLPNRPPMIPQTIPQPTTYSQGIMITAPVIDSCPAFTPATYSQWKREVKLRIAGQNGATQTQLLPKLISVLPPPAKISGLTYMEQTEISVESRSINQFTITLDERYGKTDSEKSWAWLNAFTEFTRSPGENFNDFWSRFFRCANRLDALNMKLSDPMVFNKALQALNLPENQTPIVISALETRGLRKMSRLYGRSPFECTKHTNPIWTARMCSRLIHRLANHAKQRTK